jgi:OOP family OmpA-OmpF porin
MGFLADSSNIESLDFAGRVQLRRTNGAVPHRAETSQETPKETLIRVMKQQQVGKLLRAGLAMSAFCLATSTIAWGVTPNTRTFSAGQQVKVQGVILSRDGNSIKLRIDDDSIGTVDLSSETKIQLKSGMIFRRSNKMDLAALVPGLHIEAQGKGSDKGDLLADKVSFDPSSMRASRQIDTRVSPLEARAGSLEGRAGQLEGRAGQLEGRAGQLEARAGALEDQERQTQGLVGQVKTVAEQANQGVSEVNRRVSDLDNYQTKDSTTVYFAINKDVLTPEAQKDLSDLAKKALSEKGYVIEVAGFADSTGPVFHNQLLSERRANAVVRFLEQNGDIPIHRILPMAGMGITHEAADNKTREGRKMNRRVEVKILVNQGVVAGVTQPTGGGTKPPSEASR